MEQLEQLAGIRDAAEKRLEEARAALERSPDAKLVASLSLLIDDLKKSIEADAGAVGTAASASETPAQEMAVEEVPVETNSAVQRGEEAIPQFEESVAETFDPAPAEAPAPSEDFSLEDSLEAELLAVDKDS